MIIVKDHCVLNNILQYAFKFHTCKYYHKVFVKTQPRLLDSFIVGVRIHSNFSSKLKSQIFLSQQGKKKSMIA